jgi:flagellar assembly protein FliH
MTAPTKFMFDTDFAGGPRKPVEPVITIIEHEAKLAEAAAAAQRRGYAQGQNDAQVEVNRRIAATLEHVAQGITAANEALQAIEARLECEAVEVAVAVARKLAPALIAREPFAEISALASDSFRQLVSAPHIVVRVNDAVYATAKEKLDEIARARTFEGRLVVLAEPDIAPGDCRIEWADGGINRDSASANAVIREAVERYIGARHDLAGPDPRRRTAPSAPGSLNDMPQDIAQDIPQENPQVIPQEIPQEVSQETSQEMPQEQLAASAPADRPTDRPNGNPNGNGRASAHDLLMATENEFRRS